MTKSCLPMFTGKYLCWSLFLIKNFEATLLKKDSTQVFSCEYCVLFKITCFKEYLRTVASMGSRKIPPETILIRKIPTHQTPSWKGAPPPWKIPTQKIPTWNIPTHFINCLSSLFLHLILEITPAVESVPF